MLDVASHRSNTGALNDMIICRWLHEKLESIVAGLHVHWVRALTVDGVPILLILVAVLLCNELRGQLIRFVEVDNDRIGEQRSCVAVVEATRAIAISASNLAHCRQSVQEDPSKDTERVHDDERAWKREGCKTEENAGSREVQCSIHGAGPAKGTEEEYRVAVIVELYSDGLLNQIQLSGVERSRNLGMSASKINNLSVLSTVPIKGRAQPLLKDSMGDCRPCRSFAEADVGKLSWRIPPTVAPSTGVVTKRNPVLHGLQVR